MIQTHCFLSGVTLADLTPVLRSEIELLFRKLIGTPEWVRHDLFVDAIFAPKVGHVSTVEPNLFPGWRILSDSPSIGSSVHGVETCKVDVANDPWKALFLKENREILCGPLVHCDVSKVIILVKRSRSSVKSSWLMKKVILLLRNITCSDASSDS